MRRKKNVSANSAAIGFSAAIVCFSLGACQSNVGDERQHQRTLVEKSAKDAERVLRAYDYTPLSPPMEGKLWVSPRFDGEGRWVAFRGGRGRGLFLANLDGGDGIVVDPHARGRLWWDHAHSFFCLRSAHGVEVLQPDEGRLAPLAERHPAIAHTACHLPRWEEPYGVLVHDGPYGRIYNHSRRGTLHVAMGRAPPEAITLRGAWGVRADASGRRVAYCSGSLRSPVLHVYDLRTSKSMRLGVGAHPIWTPDGKKLIFARPAGYGHQDGLTMVTAADLFVWDSETSDIDALTETPGIAEMEPALSPDGKTLVFADWRKGESMAGVEGDRRGRALGATM